jgi:hypothetical protein
MQEIEYEARNIVIEIDDLIRMEAASIAASFDQFGLDKEEVKRVLREEVLRQMQQSV